MSVGILPGYLSGQASRGCSATFKAAGYTKQSCFLAAPLGVCSCCSPSALELSELVVSLGRQLTWWALGWGETSGFGWILSGLMYGLDEHRCLHQVEGMRFEESCHCSESSGSDGPCSTTPKAMFPSCQAEEATAREAFLDVSLMGWT